MAHPLVWPGKYFFYPIGNTSAVCLTRDLAPEEPANTLLLGCGDPRNILYTIFCEPLNMKRKLDFTCCDFDPAVLARNVILLTMVADGKPHTTTVWNMFFHMYLDKGSHSILLDHCRKLIGFSDTLQHWNTSPYGRYLRMSTEYTLAELRRHWSLYVGLEDLPRERVKHIRDAFTKQSKSSSQMSGTIMSPARSSGPLMLKAIKPTSDHFKKYWKTGVTFSDTKQTAAATLLNPTFVYSLGGEGCCVHYATDPLVPFHLANLFGNAKHTLSIADIVKAAKDEFSSWCTVFHNTITLAATPIPVIRFFVGEATAVCRAISSFAKTGALKSGVPVAQWKTQLIQLSESEYGSGNAPAAFNVIDTSNLDDHIGLLNVLIAAVPLMSGSTGTGVLYAESLLFRGQDATKEFAEHLYTDITTIGILLGLCPVDYLSGFTTRSNTHELMTYISLKGDTSQFHQVTTWKSPASGDSVAAGIEGGSRPPTFDSRQLGTLLYDIYQQIFEQEDAMRFWKLNQNNIKKAISSSNIIHYTRESFVLFLKLVRDRLSMPEERWLEVMDRFFDLIDADTSMPMDANNYQDLCAHLHRQAVYTVSIYRTRLPKIGIFSSWETIPHLVRIILTVPRHKLAVLEHSVEQVGTPPLHCDVRGTWSHNIFSSVHVAFGRVVSMGTKTRPRASLEEDPEGWKGTSSLIASFTMPTRLLTDIESMDKISVCFSVRSTTGTVILVSKLGLQLTLFSAKLMDESHVIVLPEQPLPSRKPQNQNPSQIGSAAAHAQIGTSGAVSVDLDDDCELVAFLTCRVSVENEDSKRLFGSGATPNISQLSPCVMRIGVGSRIQDLIYPFPIAGTRHKLRLARKSLYIEVVVPISGPFKIDGMKLNLFPVIGRENVLSPWNVHHLNLSSLPILDIKTPKTDQWLNAHIGSMMSTRERSLRKKHENDALMFIKDTLHSIFVRSAGIQGGPARRLFSLRDKVTNNCDTIFFISDLRFDLHSHTMVCDGYVLPLTHELMPRIEGNLSKLVHNGNMVDVSVLEGEMKTWKQLLPALVERCRSSWTHGGNCEYKSQAAIPLTQTMEVDPICSCGRGKDVEGMSKVSLWSQLAPYVTRVALSPLFAVSYLETVGRDPAAKKCFVCRGKGKPKLMTCTVCKRVRYCSRACQKKDWNVHKTQCKA